MKRILSLIGAVVTPELLTSLSLVGFGIALSSLYLHQVAEMADPVAVWLSISALALTYLLILGTSLRLLTVGGWSDFGSPTGESLRGRRILKEATDFLPLVAILALVASHEATHPLSTLLWTSPGLDLLSSVIPLAVLAALALLWVAHRLWRLVLAIPLAYCAFMLVGLVIFSGMNSEGFRECMDRLTPPSCAMTCYEILEDEELPNSPIGRLLDE